MHACDVHVMFFSHYVKNLIYFKLNIEFILPFKDYIDNSAYGATHLFLLFEIFAVTERGGHK